MTGILKNKKIYVTIALIIVALLGLVIYFSFIIKKDYYIAVAGPMSGQRKYDGEAMLKGINLCLDEINKKGGINGRKILARIFDDKGQTRIAMNIASQISEDKDILLTLGHFDSSTSYSAGSIYRKTGVPAITASATAVEVTRENDFYFRVITNNAFEGSFIANYLKTLGKQSATIIYNKDTYGTSLVESFEKTAKTIGIAVKKKWGFDSESETINEDMSKIITELRAISEPGMLFLAVHGNEAPKIIKSLKFSGADFSIFGPDSFATVSFISGFKEFPEEQTKPGYYTDGIYCASPFMAEIANEKAQKFRKLYMQKYLEEPLWPSACYYDAALVAVEAIKSSDIGNSDQIRKSRREIRTSLANMYRQEDALIGVTGPIYFDKNGDVNRPMAVGEYKKQTFMPAYLQYQLIPDPPDSEVTLKKVLKGDIFVIEGKNMHKYKVVYTGIDVNEIFNLDIKKSTYSMDFYIWFRFEGELDDKDINFVNAASPIDIGKPIFEEQKDGITLRAYRVKGNFKGNFDFSSYPFDKHNLEIKFHHKKDTREQLIYVVDILALPDSVLKAKHHEIDFKSSVEWKIIDKFYYQDIKTDNSTRGKLDSLNEQNKYSYSMFNLSILIKKTGI
ncbi:MAG: ABC transporter substrate-binding protein, partial [Desulfobacterales bacterium]|nr:ABC transporter substrate-binding protein [Desulfobacterales bacterium]